MYWRFEESIVKYKTDLSKYCKTLPEETKRFRKEGKGYVTKIFSALKKIKCMFNRASFIEEINYSQKITFLASTFFYMQMSVLNFVSHLAFLNCFLMFPQIFDIGFRRNHIMVQNVTLVRTHDWSLCYMYKM